MLINKIALIAVPEFIKSHFSEEGYKKWLNSITPEAKNIYAHKITEDWYDLKTIFLDPVQKMCELFYDGDLFGAEEIGVYGAESSLNSFFRFFIKLGSPEFLIKRVSALFSNYYKNVTVDILELRKGAAKIRVNNFGKMEEINERVIIGWIIKALEFSGARNIKISANQKIINKKNVIDFKSTWD